MSGQVHDVGSVLNFWPDIARDYPQSGIALVVVTRDCWTIKTELRRVVLVAGVYVVDDQSEPDAGELP